jgi:uracil-DNA glycosylase family protein
MPRRTLEQYPTAAPFVPDGASLAQLRDAVQSCRGCPLHRRATQAVFGAGGARARVVLIGEQPGDREDLEGKPFVGPAGRLLDEVLIEAGIDRASAYVTNAVKHFKWEPRGKRRIHQRPTTREIAACKPWIDAELERIRPIAIVALGATAAQSFLGAAFRITKERGRLLETAHAPVFVATHHPSAVLRAPDAEARARMRAELVEDLRTVARRVARERGPTGPATRRASASPR